MICTSYTSKIDDIYVLHIKTDDIYVLRIKIDDISVLFTLIVCVCA